MRKLLKVVLLFMIFSSTAEAATLKLCVPSQGGCVYIVAQNNPHSFNIVTADTEEFKRLKLIKQTFPIKLVSTAEMDTIEQGPVAPVEVTSAEVEKLRSDMNTAHIVCNIASITCVTSSVATVSEILKGGPEAGIIPFIGAVATCIGTVVTCQDYWKKFDEYEKAYTAEVQKAHPKPSSAGGDPPGTSGPGGFVQTGGPQGSGGSCTIGGIPTVITSEPGLPPRTSTSPRLVECTRGN